MGQLRSTIPQQKTLVNIQNTFDRLQQDSRMVISRKKDLSHSF